ncbi:RPR [Musa troglodytarum]|uniref:RPR n=1 Tax=Musa troglodytarum TaxID=320322 RepID=A0A9E7KAI8_9LILI|nr:RPR [Musa troglodytarum]
MPARPSADCRALSPVAVGSAALVLAMGTSRRKGSGRAAAAVAQQQQWKVGDLVLAKMRGFPAWPAMISEPEKWGFSAVRKKLFVYFYGTKQIAFCNYADIEAFTEEKKKSLLLKRQGKGADFVRAVDEIIDIYETLKKQDLYESNTSNDKVEPCAENLKLVGTRSNSFSFRNRLELVSHVDSDRKLETACDLEETNDTVDSEEVSATSTADDSQKDLVIDEPLQMVTVLDRLRQNSLGASITSKKKRFRDDSQDSSFLQKSVPSRRGFKSSLVADSSITQESTSVYDSDLSGDLIPDVILGVNAESKSKQHASHTSNFHVMDVPCTASMPSNGCREETGTEIVAKDYEACQLNIGFVESNCLHETSTNGCLGDKDKLNRNIELPTKSSVHKKIKSNRKQVNDAAECAVLNKEDDLQVVHGYSPPNSFNEMKEINQKADGDEHLPLVKRARVRMGKPVAEETQHGELICGDEKLETSTVVTNCDEQHTSPTFTNMSLLEGTLLTGKKDLNLSLLNNCSPPSAKVHMFWKAKNYQLKDSMLDVEAALPPSKRLHRALEAMSANATEATESCTESARAIEANIFMASDAKFGSPIRLQSICSSDCDTHAISTSGSVSQNLDIPSLSSSEVKTHDILTEIEIVRRPQNKVCNKILQNVAKCNGFSVSKAIAGITQKESPQPCSSKCTEEVNATPSDNLADNARLSLDKTNMDMMGDKDGSHHIRVDHINRDESVELVHKQDAILNADGGIHFVPPDEAVLTVSAADMVSIASSTSGATMSSFQSDEDSQTVNMQGAVKETQHRQTPKGRCISPDLMPMKELIAAAQAKRILSRSTSFSHSYLDGKIVPDAIVSPSLVHKGDFSGQGFLPNSLVNNTSTGDDKSNSSQNGGKIPHIGLQLKCTNRSNHVEANAAWKTFEALLCTLTRTKESIGRATRLAIDCAKYGLAAEVIELLLQNLEKEQSLHKRIDLFFLVDSITQCSRSQKGGVGDVYLSLVQSVLSRLLSAAAPHGNAASENRRQCLKARTLSNCFRLLFTINSNFQLPFLVNTNVLEDEEGNASDGKSFEAVTPERCAEMDEKGTIQTSIEKNPHVLEDVDVELEMEVVSPPVKMNSSGFDIIHSHHQTDQQHLLPFAPPLPEDRPPSPPPLPSSPPPPPPPPSLGSPCSTTHSVVPQWQSGVHALADAIDLHLPRTDPNMQNQQSQYFSQQPCNQDAHLMSCKPAPQYGPGYGCLPGEMPPPASVPYGGVSASHPCNHYRNDFQPLASTSLMDTGYRLQPPPPTVSNQFSYVQAEPQQRAHPWGNCPFPERFQYAHESHRGSLHGDQVATGPLYQDIVARNRLSPVLQPGSSLRDKVGASPASLPPYGCTSEPPSMTCNGWSHPPRISNYSIPTSRPSIEGATSKVAGACGYWRPR